MSDLGRKAALAAKFVCNLRGGSQPILVEASDGLLYVAKFTDNLQGPNLPFNESIGSELYRACGLAVPLWKPLLVTDDFLDQNPGCWLQTAAGRLRPDSGLCFGSRYLGGNGTRLLEILPGTSFRRIRNRLDFWLAWLIDICAGHADNRQAVFVEDTKGWLDAFFVDSGHLFGGPKGGHRLHFLASRYLDPRVYKNVSSQDILRFQRAVASLNVDQLWREVQALPEEWKTESALDGLNECLSRLSTPRLLQGAIEAMIDADERTNGPARREIERGRVPSVEILRPGVQAKRLEPCNFANGVGYLACA
jgi:hypothetical protein